MELDGVVIDSTEVGGWGPGAKPIGDSQPSGSRISSNDKEGMSGIQPQGTGAKPGNCTEMISWILAVVLLVAMA